MTNRLALLATFVILASPLASPASADHIGDTRNCDNFPNQAAAQAHYREHPGDQDRLDGFPENRIACDSVLPCPCDLTPVARTTSSTAAPVSGRTADGRFAIVTVSQRTYDAILQAMAEGRDPVAVYKALTGASSVAPFVPGVTTAITPPSTGDAGIR